MVTALSVITRVVLHGACGGNERITKQHPMDLCSLCDDHEHGEMNHKQSKTVYEFFCPSRCYLVCYVPCIQ
jgi:hypothetical protein